MDSKNRRQLKDDLRALLAPVVARCGAELVAVDLGGTPRKPLLRLYIDRSGGVTVDLCAEVSRAVSPVLDVEDPIPSAYELEVSSPGIDRPVERPEDFARFKGYRAKVRLASGVERRAWTGLLGGLEDGQVLLEVGGETHRFPMALVDRVRLDLTLEEFARLGSPTGQADLAGSAEAAAEGDVP